MIFSKCCKAPVTSPEDNTGKCNFCKSKEPHYFKCSHCGQSCCVVKVSKGGPEC